MSQKSILSFFKKSTETKSQETNGESKSTDEPHPNGSVKKEIVHISKSPRGKCSTKPKASKKRDQQTSKRENSKTNSKKTPNKRKPSPRKNGIESSTEDDAKLASDTTAKSPAVENTNKSSYDEIDRNGESSAEGNANKSSAETDLLINGDVKQSSTKVDVQDEQKACNYEDSPIKKTKKRKRARLVESDDSDDCCEKQENNKSKDVPQKMEIDSCGESSKTKDEESKSEEQNSDEMSPNGEVKSAKRKKEYQSSENDEEPATKKRVKLETTPENENCISSKSDVKEKSAEESSEDIKSNSDSLSKNPVEFPIKRKTARKAFKSEPKTGKSDPVDKKLVTSDKKDSDGACKGEKLEETTEKSDIELKTDTDNAKSGEVEEKSELNEKPDVPKVNVKEEKMDTEEEDGNKKPDSKEAEKKSKAMHPFFGSKNKEAGTSDNKENTNKSGTAYDPSKSHYHPIEDACWKRGEKVPYLALAKTLDLIENTSGRLKTIEILSNFLRSVIALTPEDLLYSVYLCLNRLAPEYEGIELGVGDMLLMRAVAQATGRTVDKIKADVAIKGDLGLVAESSRGNQRVMFPPPKLTVSSVFAKFKEISSMTGNASMSKKTDKIQLLFVACRECEAKFIIRSLSGKLRIGLAEQSVLSALAKAAVLTPPNQSYPPDIIDKSTTMSPKSFTNYLQEQQMILKTTYCECPNFDLIIPVLLKEGISGLPEHCQLSPGCPLKPMLAHPTNGIGEVLNRFDKKEFTCEFKYDGERAQIHMNDKGEIKIYSRNQEDNTSKYPDIISRIPKTLKETTKSFILDSEVVAWDCEAKQILPFQILSTRKKKDAVESDIVVRVCIMAFDLLYINGESLVKKPLKERREFLHTSFEELSDEFMFVTYRDGDSAETMQEFLDESKKGNCEGLMVKALLEDASYEIAKRSHNWLKLKKDYLQGVGDTLDLVVIGGYFGKGKRTGNYGGFLLACYDDDNEEYQSICKLGTGFTEDELDTHTKFLKQHVITKAKSYYRYDHSLEPDEWFDDLQVWEIKCADLSISPIHRAAIGIVDPEKGISLRFPRFLRIREDKKPTDATNSSQVAELYQKQDQVQNTGNRNIKMEEDYY